MHILIIEDERTIAENLYAYLESRGHQCDYAATLTFAEALLEQKLFDVLILDRNMPDGDGLTLVRRLRSGGMGIPVLVLTAKDTLEDKLNGFDAGADDYLVKPFALQEVEVRLQALYRRGSVRKDDGCWKQGALEYTGASQEVRLAGEVLRLPPKGVRLIAELIQHPNRVFLRRELEIAVWGREQDSSDNLRSVLNTVRRSLGESAGVEVVSVHGMGYKLVVR